MFVEVVPHRPGRTDRTNCAFQQILIHVYFSDERYLKLDNLICWKRQLSSVSSTGGGSADRYGSIASYGRLDRSNSEARADGPVATGYPGCAAAHAVARRRAFRARGCQRTSAAEASRSFGLDQMHVRPLVKRSPFINAGSRSVFSRQHEAVATQRRRTGSSVPKVRLERNYKSKPSLIRKASI